MTRYSKVDKLPFVFGILTKTKLEEIKKSILGQPKNMDYRKEFIKGRGASTKDETWNRNTHEHTCCKSKVPWRHMAKCEKVLKDNDDYSDLI